MKYETAKRLRKIAEKYGVELPSSKQSFVNKNDSSSPQYEVSNLLYEHGFADVYGFPCYTTDELLEWLPEDIIIWRDSKEKYFAKRDGYDENFSGKSPSEALAELAIILIKKGILK